jgi:hypothetical protein
LNSKMMKIYMEEFSAEIFDFGSLKLNVK